MGVWLGNHASSGHQETPNVDGGALVQRPIAARKTLRGALPFATHLRCTVSALLPYSRAASQTPRVQLTPQTACGTLATVQTVFEKYQCPAVFVAKDAVLSCFANARGTAVVYDCGATVTTATPVHDGYAIQKAIVKSNIGGDLLDAQMLKQVKHRLLPAWPMCSRLVHFTVSALLRPAPHRVRVLDAIAHTRRNRVCVCRQSVAIAAAAGLPLSAGLKFGARYFQMAQEKWRQPMCRTFHSHFLTTSDCLWGDK